MDDTQINTIDITVDRIRDVAGHIIGMLDDDDLNTNVIRSLIAGITTDCRTIKTITQPGPVQTLLKLDKPESKPEKKGVRAVAPSQPTVERVAFNRWFAINRQRFTENGTKSESDARNTAISELIKRLTTVNPNRKWNTTVPRITVDDENQKYGRYYNVTTNTWCAAGAASGAAAYIQQLANDDKEKINKKRKVVNT